ncbi:adhesion G-protein coupled receptor G2 [Grus japonensis]|uniref:Adhesion G-protein coupled receptor G2 n=1 Tax=Grus japonensis TaxID=30415 RepID=A0ABC9W0T6_GRUJA
MSPNLGMTGELYMFRMWDKANIKQSLDCKDSGVIRWRKEDWVYNKTVEEDNSLPCDMSSEETTQTAETLNITDYYSAVTPVFYVGKVKLQAREESNTSLSVEIINNITINNQVTKLIAIPAPTLQELSIHCNFIMKLAERENISSLTDKAEISKIGFTKHSAVSSSELSPKPPIAVPPFETTTKSAAQIHRATDSTQVISGNKNVTAGPILPLTPFTITLTPTVSPVNRSVSASHPHSTADGHGSLPNGSTGKILSSTTYTTSVYTTTNTTTAEQIVSKIENDLAAGKVEPKDVERMVSEVSKVLTASQPLPPRISNRIIKLVDYIGLKLNFPTTSADFASPSLALAVVKTNSIRSNQMSFAVQDSADLQDLSLKNASLISNVISSSVANLTVSNLKANVTVTLQNIKPNQDNSTVRCVFWDFNKNGLPAVVVSIVLAVSPDNYGLITTGKVSINRPDEL